MSGTPPTNQAEDDEGGGQAAAAREAEVEAAAQVEVDVEEVSVRRLSLQAVGSTVASEQEGEESKPHVEEEAGPADSEPIPTERDGEEGSRAQVTPILNSECLFVCLPAI